MLCKGIVEEVKGKKACWLPAEKTSGFQLCRRCHFHRITEILDSLTQAYTQEEIHPSSEIFLADSSFLQELLHPAREQALLNLLASLFRHNRIQFSLLLERLSCFSVFPILLTKRIQAHQAGPRCAMYRHFLKDPKLYTSDSLCWNCWSCIAWTVRQKDTRLHNLYTQNFGLHFSELTFPIVEATGSGVFVDYFASLYLLGKHHHIRTLFDQFFRRFPLEHFKRFLVCFFQHPVLLSIFFEQRQNEFLPLALQDPVVVAEMYGEIKQGIKKWTDTYKEELIMRTWHPSRLFRWCFDIEELNDFDQAEIAGEML
jgi:hypothetical protein